MKHLQIAFKHFKRMTMARFSFAFAALILSMIFSASALAGKPDKNIQYDFNFIFAGDNPIFFETNKDEQGNSMPWSVTSPAKDLGAINLGPVPMYAEAIAAIGDYARPCNLTGVGDCAARVGVPVDPLTDPGSIMPDQLSIAPTGSRNPEYIRLWFGFSVLDETDEPPTLYEYVAKAFSESHIVEWDPTQADFCAHITFRSRWVLEYFPADYQRKKQCRDSTYFAVCEADDAEQQWQTTDFQMKIWRANHQGYLERLRNGGSPLDSPC